MPPKGKDKGGGSKVTVDKTFGMKNKKGGKGQKQVQLIQQQQATAGKSKEQLAREKQKAAEKKAAAEAAKMRAADPLFTITQPKVPFGVDPKSVTCAFWKAGKCDKGSRCKYGHSLDAGRKVEKKDLYTDTREDDKKNDTMDKWDLAKLGEVVLSKHGNPKSTTDKVCKFFLQAVEDGKYGWFWECPNGGEKCMYRHRLPPGFVLKSQKKELEELEKANEISLEDFLETERHKLGSNLTPVTAETFAKWKKERVDKKAAEEEMLKAKKAAQAQANKMAGLSGREMFTLNPDMFVDDDEGDEDGEFDMKQYFTKDWEQGRQSDDEDDGDNEEGAGEDEEGEGKAGSGSATDQITDGVEKMSVQA
ncbi:Translation machinery-associated protein 46 [Thecaphora frezii]